jgi:hypothetical protein
MSLWGRLATCAPVGNRRFLERVTSVGQAGKQPAAGCQPALQAQPNSFDLRPPSRLDRQHRDKSAPTRVGAIERQAPAMRNRNRPGDRQTESCAAS